MRESMMRDDGKTLRYGRLFELLDSLAGDIAYRHCGGRKGPLTIVTASVDSMKNFANLSIHNDIKMQGYLTYVGSSSMEVITDLIIMLPISSSCCQSYHHAANLIIEISYARTLPGRDRCAICGRPLR